MNTITETAPAPEQAPESIGRDGEQSRARYPDSEGFAERDGQRLFYEVYGEGEETIFLLPTWSLVHSRHWKMQIHYFARHFRVLTMDGLGNGRSDRCRDPERYSAEAFARDCLAVMDATGTERAVMASLSRGAQFLLELERIAPERVAGAAFIGPLFPYTPSHWSRAAPRPTERSPRAHAVPLVGPSERDAVGRAPLPRVRGVVHFTLLLRGALDQGHRGRDRVGPRDRRRRRWRQRPPTRKRSSPAVAHCGIWLRGSTARCS